MIILLNQYSLEIYDAIINNKISISKLYTSLKNKNKKEITCFKKLSDKKVKELAKELDKYQILDDILFMTNNRFKHLKENRNLLNLDKFMETVFTDSLFMEKLRLYYSYKIIDKILEKYYDITDIKFLSDAKRKLIDLERELNIKICNGIDEYYIKLITN